MECKDPWNGMDNNSRVNVSVMDEQAIVEAMRCGRMNNGRK